MPSKKQTPTPASLPKKKSQKESPATPKKETAGNIMVPPSPQKQESKAPSDRGNVFDKKKMIAIRDFLDAAEKSMASARKLIASLAPSGALRHDLDINTSSLASYDDGEEKIIEGVFTWEYMLGADKSVYPVPQNYASKSHLVQGSKVKAIIQKDGKITYKIIGEIEYEVKLWILTKTKDRFQVIAENKAYNVILAAVTYLKAQVGDTVSIRVPKWKEATYGALEAVIPKKD